LTINPFRRISARVLLSRAKHRSLPGHPKLARRLARWIPEYNYTESNFFSSDDAPHEVQEKRREGFNRLADLFQQRFSKTIAFTEELESSVSDLAFVNANRVPFQYRDYVSRHLKMGSIVDETDGPRVRDLDGNWSYDLGGSYGVNLFGVQLL